jgi:hypothetical protein
MGWGWVSQGEGRGRRLFEPIRAHDLEIGRGRIGHKLNRDLVAKPGPSLQADIHAAPLPDPFGAEEHHLARPWRSPPSGLWLRLGRR